MYLYNIYIDILLGSINKMLFVIDKSFKMTFFRRTLVQYYYNLILNLYTQGDYLVTINYVMIIQNAEASNTLKQWCIAVKVNCDILTWCIDTLGACIVLSLLKLVRKWPVTHHYFKLWLIISFTGLLHMKCYHIAGKLSCVNVWRK